MKRWLPRFSVSRWGGGLDDVGEDRNAEGWSLLICWLGIAVELCAGRVR